MNNLYWNSKLTCLCLVETLFSLRRTCKSCPSVRIMDEIELVDVWALLCIMFDAKYCPLHTLLSYNFVNIHSWSIPLLPIFVIYKIKYVSIICSFIISYILPCSWIKGHFWHFHAPNFLIWLACRICHIYMWNESISHIPFIALLLISSYYLLKWAIKWHVQVLPPVLCYGKQGLCFILPHGSFLFFLPHHHGRPIKIRNNLPCTSWQK